MNISNVKFYQIPYNYKSIDRFYKKESGEVNLPEPIRVLTGEGELKQNLSYMINTFLISTMNIWGEINFNYIEINYEDEEDEKDYWFVTDVTLIKPKYNKLTLKKDIMTSYNLIKQSNLNETINISRKLFNNFDINDGSTITYKNERNPHIWNNQEFNQVVPKYKNIKPFSLSELLIATDQKFINGNTIFKIPEEWKDVWVRFAFPMELFYTNENEEIRRAPSTSNSTYMGDIPLSPLITLLKEILQTSNYQRTNSNLSHIASLNEEYIHSDLSVYTVTSQCPVVYNNKTNYRHLVNGEWKNDGFPIKPEEWFSQTITPNDLMDRNAETFEEAYDITRNNFVNSHQVRNILKDEELWDWSFKKNISSNQTFTCPWGHRTNLTAWHFLMALKYILSGFYHNTVEKLSSRPGDLISVDAYSSWFSGMLRTVEQQVGDEGGIRVVSSLHLFPTTLIITNIINNRSRNEDGNWDLDYHSRFNNEPHKLAKVLTTHSSENFNHNLGEKIDLNINNDLLTEWDKYKYLTPQLFSQNYNYNYIDIIGNQLPLDNHKLYHSSNLLIRTWVGTSEQNISYYQGDFNEDGDLIEPRYSNKFALSQPIEFSVNKASETYQLQKNRLDAKLNEVVLSKERETNYIRNITNSKINLATSNYNVDRRLNIEKTNLQSAFNLETKDYGSSWHTGASLIESTFNQPWLADTVKDWWGNKANQMRDYWRGATGADDLIEARNQLMRDNTIQLNRSMSSKIDNANIAYASDRSANIERLSKNALSQRLLVEADIADIKLIPNQIMNSSDITKMISLEKGEISLINENLNEIQQREMFKYWNKHGIKNWRSLSTKGEWFNEFSLYDYFQGGDWTKYLNNIGIYNIELINEFNIMMSSGLRLHHQSNDIYNKLEELELATSPNDINHDIPNWPKDITNLIQ